jgi:hypothetical protein
VFTEHLVKLHAVASRHERRERCCVEDRAQMAGNGAGIFLGGGGAAVVVPCLCRPTCPLPAVICRVDVRQVVKVVVLPA